MSSRCTFVFIMFDYNVGFTKLSRFTIYDYACLRSDRRSTRMIMLT